jgi:hypothetical protein
MLLLDRSEQPPEQEQVAGPDVLIAQVVLSPTHLTKGAPPAGCAVRQRGRVDVWIKMTTILSRQLSSA